MTTNDILLVKEIANLMKDPDVVQMHINHPLNRNPFYSASPWQPLTLSHGFPAILLLFATLNDLFPSENWDQISHSYVLKIKETLEKEKISDLSLFGGLAGCCFAIQAASQKKTRYQKLLSKMNDYLVSQTRKEYFGPLYEKIELNLPARAELYDPISGIIGIGAYALQNLDDPFLYSLLREILTICVAISKPIAIDKYTLPGWYIPSHYQFTEQDKKRYPRGNFNLGMAHGVSGLLAFLSLSLSQNILVEGQTEAIERISTWIQSKKIVNNNNVYWLDRISFENEVGSDPLGPSHFTMDAWCYGTAGVSRSLYLTGKALNKIELQEIAIEAFLSALNRIHSDYENCSPTFCHGLAGILTMSKLMARDTKLDKLEKSVSILKERLINLYDPSYPFGFKDQQPLSDMFVVNNNAETQMIQIDSAGLLTGVSGILLSLLSTSLEQDQWTHPFLINGVL